MKKAQIVAAALTGVVAISALTGCSTSANSSGPTTIKVGLWGAATDFATITPVIKKFEKAYPNIHVQVVTGDCGISWAACKTLIAAGSMPDVFVPHISIYKEAVNAGVLADLSPYMKKDNISASDFSPSSIMDALKTKTGQIDGLPMGFNVQSLYYNKSMFDAANLSYPDPSGNYTWQDVANWSKELTIDDNGKHSGDPGFDAQHVKQYGFYSTTDYGIIQGWGPIVSAYGAGVLTGAAGTGCSLDSQGSIQAFQLLQDMMYKDHSMITPALNQEQPGYLRWVQGHVAMQQGSNEQVGDVQQMNPTLKYDMAALPKGPAGNATLVQEHDWAAYSKSQHLDADWTFIKYMTTVGSVDKQMDLIPAYKNTYSGAAFLKSPGEPAHLKEAQIDPLSWPLAKVLVDPQGVFDEVFSQDGVSPAITKIIEDKAPASQALAGTCTAVNKILAAK